MEHIIHITDLNEANYQVLKDSKSQTTDLYLSYCGMQRCTPSYCCSDDPRTDFLIHFILNGKGLFHLGPRAYPVQKGQAFFIPPGTRHYSYISDSQDPWTYMWIGFNGRQAQSYLRYTGLSAASPVCDVQNLEDIRQVMQDLLQTKALTLPNDIKRDGYLYKILSLLIVSYQSTQTGNIVHDYPSQTYAIYARNYIDHNFARANITDIAKMIGIDRSYLHSVFRKNFNISPQEYLIQCRLEFAARLLQSSTFTIQQIAHEAGYEDPLQFSKIFKKHYGVSPRAYRTAHEDGGMN